MKIIYYVLYFVCGISSSVLIAANDPNIQSVRLTQDWEFVRGDLGGVWEAIRSDKLSGDLPVWQKINLPHCYNASNSVDPDIAYYQGPAWYRTQLKIDNPFLNGRTLLHFEGAGQKTEVYIDTQKIDSHTGGYDEFVVDITDAVAAYLQKPYFEKASSDRISRPGRIPLVIRCDNSRDLETIPSDLSDFNRYGGLYRHVNLVYVPAISLERIYVYTERRQDNSWQLVVKGRLYNPQALSDSLAVHIQLFDPDGKELHTVSKTLSPWKEMEVLFKTEIQKPRLWSVQTPGLYQGTVTLDSRHGQSKAGERFGFRWFEFAEKGPFYLNDRRLLLRGTHRHEDHAGLAAAMTDDLIDREMRLTKEMGVNFIRLGHYQQSRRVLDLCDQLGILVWEEIPWCRGGLGGTHYQQQARDMLRAMIDQHRNHPSVIIWGLGNENDWPGDFETFDKEQIRVFMKELHDLSHALDPERKTAIRRCEFCSDIVDVYSPSIWAGWYRGKFTEYKDVSQKEKEKVGRFLHVEWGGDSHAGRHAENPYTPLADVKATGQADERGMDYLMAGGSARASKDGDWSESYICDLVDWHLKEQETMNWLTGTAFWVFKDFSTPLRPDNPVPFMNQKGAVQRDLTPKDVYYVYQSYWTDKPMIYVYSHTWPVRWGGKDELKTVKIYSNCTEAELFVNGKSAGIKKRNSQDFPAAGLRWQVALNEGTNHLKAVGKKEGIEVTDEVAFRYETRRWGKPATLILKETARKGDIAAISVELLDEAGVVCLDKRDFVRFDLTGDGTLIDNLGTPRGSRKVQLCNGQAQIQVHLNGGKSVASVSCKGCPTAFVELMSSK